MQSNPDGGYIVIGADNIHLSAERWLNSSTRD